MQNVDERLLKYMTKDERAQYAEAQRVLEEAQKKAEEAKADLGNLSGLLEQREKEEQQFWKAVDERHENVFAYLAVKYPDLLEKELRYRQYRDRKDEEEHGESVSDTDTGMAEEAASADVSETSGEEHDPGGVSNDSSGDPAEDVNDEAVIAENAEADDMASAADEEPVKDMEESDANPEDDELPDVAFLNDDADEPGFAAAAGESDDTDEIPEEEEAEEDLEEDELPDAAFLNDPVEDIHEETSDAEDGEAGDAESAAGEEFEEESDVDPEDDELPDADFLKDPVEEPDPVDVKDEPDDAEEGPDAEVSEEENSAEPKSDVIGHESIPVSIKAVNPHETAAPYVNYDFDRNIVYANGKKSSETTEFDENSDGTEDIDDIEDSDDEPAEEADMTVDDEESGPEEVEEEAVQEESKQEANADDSESDEDEEYVVEDEDADAGSSDDPDAHETVPAESHAKPVKLLDGTDIEVKEKVEKGYSKLLIECASKINDYVEKSADELQNYKTEEDIDRFASEAMETTSKIYDESLRSMGGYRMRHQFAIRPEMCRKWSDALYKVFDTSSDYMHEKVRERKNELK